MIPREGVDYRFVKSLGGYVAKDSIIPLTRTAVPADPTQVKAKQRLDTKKIKVRPTVYTFMQNNRRMMPMAEIAEGVGIKNSKVSAALSSLKAQGLVRTNGKTTKNVKWRVV